MDKGKPRDFVGTTWATIHLISSRFIDVLTEGSITGWRAVPVEIPGSELGGKLFVLVVTGRCGPLVYADRFKLERYLDPEASGWDGSDLFLPEGFSGTLATRETAAYLRKARLSNLRLEGNAIRPLPTTID